MNYRHIFHAGSFADVVKHVVVVAILQHLRRKEKPFQVIDAHAGRGLYHIESPEADRSREAAGGIGRIQDLDVRTDLPDSLRTYLNCVNAEKPGNYPGSPRIAARLLRPQDRLVAIEKNREEAEALSGALAMFPNARTIAGDAYDILPSLLPPRERRGVVILDPPYEADDEFLRIAQLTASAHRRFATGVFLLWFPTKSAAAEEALIGELQIRGIAPAMRIVIDIGRNANEERQRLSSAAVVVVNPPYMLEEEIGAAAKWLAPRLGLIAPAEISLSPL